jgi:hypothetical protein
MHHTISETATVYGKRDAILFFYRRMKQNRDELVVTEKVFVFLLLFIM